MNSKRWLALLMTAVSALPVGAAVVLAGDEAASPLLEAEYAGVRRSICPPEPGAPPFNFEEAFDTGRQKMDPVRLFDNLYFVGMKTVSAWALTTPDGIILLDAMLHYNVKETIVAGLEQLGLDPAAIRYVLVAHGHNDHFGGAAWLQETYGARIVMSAQDWDHIRTWPQLGSPAPLPKQDIEARDGDEITLGGTTVKLVLTPGHTPGTMSFIFDVQDGGSAHRVGYWGGGAVGYLGPEDIETYIASAERFAMLDPAVDVEMSNHPFLDGSLLKFEALAKRAPGAVHPAVTGNAAFRHWMGVFAGCAGEVLAQKRSSK
jgi:metallo-beta-lactamase class B